jgi:uncharacterized protein (TIGR03492 family)
MSDLLSSTLKSNPQTATSKLRLLVLSNGHGEDVIATRIIKELQKLPNAPDIYALPLVGEGHAYRNLEIPLIGSVKSMPSGGFIYMDGRELIKDVKGGLIKLTLSQIKAVRSWVKEQKKLGHKKAILSVGDIVPSLFAWASGANYAFVGTAKSEYYVRDEARMLQRNDKGAKWENFSGSIYHPWERWLITRRRCRAVFPRDSLTTEILKKFKVSAYDLGNPMMDGLEPSRPPYRFYSQDAEREELERPLVITLLPGSRAPEAFNNWQQIMIAVSAIMGSYRERNNVLHTSGTVVFLAAIASSLDVNAFAQTIKSHGWRSHPMGEMPLQLPDANAISFKQKNAYFILSHAYNDILHLADFAIAMAGTATEQFVGLGKPAITIPGKGPQFNPGFAEAQSRHLGDSIILVKQPAEVAAQIQSLFANPDRLHVISQNGFSRMGKSGAAKRIAECLIDRLG